MNKKKKKSNSAVFSTELYVKKTARFPVKPWYIIEHFYAFVPGILRAKVQKRNASTPDHYFLTGQNLKMGLFFNPQISRAWHQIKDFLYAVRRYVLRYYTVYT